MTAANPKDIRVLGSGCANCKATIALIEQAVARHGIAASISKVDQMQDIISYGVMSTPAVVIDGKVVHAGGIPAKDKVDGWMQG